MSARSLPADAIEALRQRLHTLPPRHAGRHQMIREIAATYGVSETTVYRTLQAYTTPRAVHRGDRGPPRALRALEAKRAIVDYLGLPLAKLSPEQLEALNTLLSTTLAKKAVWEHVRRRLEPCYRR